MNDDPRDNDKHETALGHVWRVPARLTAIGFIVFILAGNFWLVYAMVRKAPPLWVGTSFALGLALAALGGIGLFVSAVRRWLTGANGTPV